MNETTTKAADIRFTLDGDRKVTVYHSAKERAILALVVWTGANGTRHVDRHELRRHTDYHDTVNYDEIRTAAEALR